MAIINVAVLGGTNYTVWHVYSDMLENVANQDWSKLNPVQEIKRASLGDATDIFEWISRYFSVEDALGSTLVIAGQTDADGRMILSPNGPALRGTNPVEEISQRTNNILTIQKNDAEAFVTGQFELLGQPPYFAGGTMGTGVRFKVCKDGQIVAAGAEIGHQTFANPMTTVKNILQIFSKLGVRLSTSHEIEQLAQFVNPCGCGKLTPCYESVLGGDRLRELIATVHFAVTGSSFEDGLDANKAFDAAYKACELWALVIADMLSIDVAQFLGDLYCHHAIPLVCIKGSVGLAVLDKLGQRIRQYLPNFLPARETADTIQIVPSPEPVKDEPIGGAMLLLKELQATA
ncbi:MAG: hypothetical protein A2445_01120 [Candidatus Jacksonbacteria bacterium RIFOXYC2_FULL_44_29]|nr:MAG: hypothetical protein A2240_00550 [Candidatus Jacksonbacteria bacterium RIFOXYA2_FULL_43_12]OGY78103.1 MAG: hypothetical protein A2550_03520 [Candidatus Jacksonbacteria bacterium RIFOXYD2_FULL_43_21]OGY79858.1 MAG: hypothetical protein A2445_01120 [Candidatus Jacksonbacteria bacterium RIFOXYC2_FULL_44_29]HCE49457.1 hypothetical protein [Candidatus Jacksonbacteria bacterium]HCR15208.1 hypothetical protein [Candidatus Jacksonbacteria bacterium]